MNDSFDVSAWRQVGRLKSLSERKYLEQEVHWAKRAKQTCFHFGDRSNKYFQSMATIKKTTLFGKLEFSR